MAVSSVDVGLYASRRRVSRRGVVVRRRLASALVAVLVGVGTLLLGGSAPASRPGAPAAIVVRPGQTMWEIAEQYAPDGIDVRAYIDAVAALNELGPVLHAGQRIKLPH